MHKLSLSLVTIAALALAGCHGDDVLLAEAPAPTIASGMFKDSSVSGLTFESGGQSGITGPDGSFSYEVGNSITFSVGGISLGSGIGAPIMTPIDLITNASSDSPRVKNIVRFLTMLDSTPPLSSGIQISSAVQTVADSWNPVDFASVDLSADLASIISDVASADARTPILLNTEDAKSHLTSTLLCLYSGAFVGTFTGSDQGRIGLHVNSGSYITSITNPPPSGPISNNTNDVEGIIYSAIDNRYAVLSGNKVDDLRFIPIGHNYIRRFISGAPDTTDVDNDANLIELESTFTGNFTSPNSASGEWIKRIPTTASGTFSGTRIGGAADALYRFTAEYISASDPSHTNDAGLFTFDIDSNNNVTGIAHSIVNNTQESLSGIANPGVNGLQLTTASGTTITGTIDLSAGTIFGGLWNDGVNNGTFSASGCQLN
ncbi:hypothetical protein MNBD_GAMMA17-122 [hydrothermal vent metagenome]|uniref:Uncharacterized protein n=1 Tax=hydrothermal vent metagenome TaxID=652676 RepID=A0A3B0ZGM2_9ZZZZ